MSVRLFAALAAHYSKKVAAEVLWFFGGLAIHSAVAFGAAGLTAALYVVQGVQHVTEGGQRRGNARDGGHPAKADAVPRSGSAAAVNSFGPN
jgi:hypothetical protein